MPAAQTVAANRVHDPAHRARVSQQPVVLGAHGDVRTTGAATVGDRWADPAKGRPEMAANHL